VVLPLATGASQSHFFIAFPPPFAKYCFCLAPFAWAFVSRFALHFASRSVQGPGSFLSRFGVLWFLGLAVAEVRAPLAGGRLFLSSRYRSSLSRLPCAGLVARAHAVVVRFSASGIVFGSASRPITGGQPPESPHRIAFYGSLFLRGLCLGAFSLKYSASRPAGGPFRPLSFSPPAPLFLSPSRGREKGGGSRFARACASLRRVATAPLCIVSRGFFLLLCPRRLVFTAPLCIVSRGFSSLFQNLLVCF
jgi:hypothetical protein